MQTNLRLFTQASYQCAFVLGYRPGKRDKSKENLLATLRDLLCIYSWEYYSAVVVVVVVVVPT
jgi:hypothetical protein